VIAAPRVRRVVEAANHAPSGDNCQPWRFEWDGETLTVRRDAGRAAHVLDHDGDASRLTLGCVLEAIALAAAHGEGLRAEVDAAPESPRDGAAWARVRFTEGAPEGGDEPLFRALPGRVTDRRTYRGGSLDHPVVAALRADGARAAGGVSLGITGDRSGQLVDYLAAVDGYVWQSDDVYRDVMKWMRLTHREVEATRDGVPWCSAGIDLPETAALSLSRAPFARRLAAGMGIELASRLWLRRQLASSAALVCVTARPPVDLVAAGRLGLRAWLRLHDAGWGVQPLTLAALLAHAAGAGRLPPGTTPAQRALFEGGRAVLARAFGLGPDEAPVWMFRTGATSALPAHMRTRRLPAERIFVAR
jgi:hypothetical protein